MKKKYLCVAGILTLSIAALQARHLSMPSLQRIHDKVSAVLEQGNTMSFKEMLENQSIQGVVVEGKTILQGLDSRTADKQSKLRDIEKRLNTLYWANLNDFINAVEIKKASSPTDAAMMLRDKIKERYGAAKGTLMLFAQELAKEEQEVKDIINDLLKAVGSDGSSGGNRGDTAQLFVRHSQVNATLQKLVGTTNTLLM